MGQIAEAFQEISLGVLPSNTMTDPRAELKVITNTDGLTLDGYFLSHSNFFEKDQEPETITEVVEIASSKSTPLVPPPETLPFGSPTLSLDPAVESLSPSLTPSWEIDLLLEETDAFLSLDDSIPPGIDNGIYDSEGDILFLEELLNDEIPRDLPPKDLKDDEPSTTKSLIEKLLEIDNEIYDSEGDILFLENLLKDDPADKSVSHHEEFVDELTHIISPSEFDYFTLILEPIMRVY
ncbi:hypothetical protein Tco_0767401 [Tanacetum coccineum]